MKRTRTFDVTAAVADVLAATTWPPHPTMGTAPQVRLGVDDSIQDAESIEVYLRTYEDRATVEWMAMAQGGRDERFIVDIWIDSSVPGDSWRAMWTRLGDLCEAVLERFVDVNGQFIAPGGYDPDLSEWLGVWFGNAHAEQHDQWRVGEGWAGRARIAIRIAARI